MKLKSGEQSGEHAKNKKRRLKSFAYKGKIFVCTELAGELGGGKTSRWAQKGSENGVFEGQFFDTTRTPPQPIRPPKRGGSGRALYIKLSSLPPAAQERYFEQARDEGLREAAPQLQDSEIAFLRELPPEEVDLVRHRLILVKKTVAAGRGQQGRIAEEAGVDDGTLSRLVRGYKKEGIDFLKDGRREKETSLNEDVKKMAFTLYADRQQPSYQQVYTTLVKKCREQDTSIPSYSAVYRFLKKTPQATIDYWRKGGAYVRKHHVPPILRLLDDLAVMECWMGDATTLDCFCTHPKRPNPVRPCLTAWMDVKSRLIVGYMVALTVSTSTVALAFRDGALPYGLPEVIYCDNGREYRNKDWRGRVVSYGKVEVAHIQGRWERLGVLPMYAWPYAPQSKAQIERWFNTLSHSFLNLLPGYSGANITARTKRKDQERLSQEIKKGALLSFDELCQAVGEAIEAYNHRPHKALGNRSPAQVCEQGFGQPRLVTERALDFCLSRVKVQTIKSGGIAIADLGVTFTSHDPDYIRNIGRKGVVRYDPREVGNAHLSAIVNKREVYCCALQPREGVAFRASEADLKAAIAKKKKTYKLIAEAARALKDKAIDVRAELREANFAVDPKDRESFERTIAERRTGGNVIQLVPDTPAREQIEDKAEGREELVGLFDDPPGGEEEKKFGMIGLFGEDI